MTAARKHSDLTAIDLFAGLGGWTEGARRAGVHVAWAANHWPLAVRFHANNHPETLHSCQDLQQADWTQVPPHDLLLASSACQGHAKARGVERPHHDAARATAWAVVSCAEVHQPYVLVNENVPEFIKWKLFPAWKLALETLGYAISVNVIDAADCGVPQNRVRVFVVGVRAKRPLIIKPPARMHVGASSFIQFDLGRWSNVLHAGRAAKTIERYEAGRRRYGNRFVFSYYGQTRGGRSLSRPIGTITTRDRWAVVDGDRMRMLTAHEARAAMGFPDSYVIPRNGRLAMHMLGNAVSPGAAEYVINEIRRAA